MAMPKLSFQYVQHEITETLLEFLVRRFRYHDVLQWETRIKSGNVKVNRKTVSADTLLQTRDKIIYDPPPAPEPPVDTRHQVLYEDDHLLAVNKSGNIPTSPSGKYWNNCLVHFLKQDRQLPELHAVHRLDRETSGVNLFAKTRLAARVMGDEFREGNVEKLYSGIVWGSLPGGEVVVSAPLRNATRGAVRIRQEVTAQGRPAKTRFTVKSKLAGATWIHAIPYTGRTHQIRAHAAFIGCPVIGDKLYGQSEAEFIRWVSHGERNSERRHLLHATQLIVNHPESGKRLAIKAPDHHLLELLEGFRDET